MASTDLLVRIIEVVEDNLECLKCKDDDEFLCERNYTVYQIRKYFKDKDTAIYVILHNMQCKCALDFLVERVIPIFKEDNIFPVYNGRSRRSTFGKFKGRNYEKVVNAILDYSEHMEKMKGL